MVAFVIHVLLDKAMVVGTNEQTVLRAFCKALHELFDFGGAYLSECGVAFSLQHMRQAAA
jgi:hypothetical protein